MLTGVKHSVHQCLAPARSTVDVWSASLALPPLLRSHVTQYLSSDEHARADRFMSERDRDHFVAARSFLRLLLAGYVDVDPSELRFCYGSQGKPTLTEVRSGLRFNLAHSGALAVCALTQGGELGVDIEHIKPINNVQGVARVVFSPREIARLESLPEPVCLRAFYEGWTRKEAFLKALGCGLGRPMDSFEVAFGPGESPRLLASVLDPTELGRFSLQAFEPEIGCVGAVATTGPLERVRQLSWRWV